MPTEESDRHPRTLLEIAEQGDDRIGLESLCDPTHSRPAQRYDVQSKTLPCAHHRIVERPRKALRYGRDRIAARAGIRPGHVPRAHVRHSHDGPPPLGERRIEVLAPVDRHTLDELFTSEAAQ